MKMHADVTCRCLAGLRKTSAQSLPGQRRNRLSFGVAVEMDVPPKAFLEFPGTNLP